jgi:agmatinase
MFVVKVPGINGLGKTIGCEKAGNLILEELKNIGTTERGKELDFSRIDLEEIHLDNSNLELSAKLIYKNAFEIFEEKKRTIFLGGDHSISYFLTRAFFDYCQNSGRDPCLIVFDAHADCRKPVNKNFPTQKEWLRQLIEDGFPSKNILLVGGRNVWKEEINFLEKNKIKRIGVNELNNNSEEITDVIMEFSNGKELYVSLDIDVVDPSFAPGTNLPEVGGLTSRQTIYVLQRMGLIKNLRAVDIVEINPEKDKEKTTIKLGAKILAEILE